MGMDAWLTPAGNRQYQGFTEDLTWRYYDNFYRMFGELRAEFPGLVFQNCTGGGGRLDWETMSMFNNTELSDFIRTTAEKTGDDPDEYLFRPRGIDPEKSYRVKLDSQKISFAISGFTLMEEGIKIRLEQPLTSELVIIQTQK